MSSTYTINRINSIINMIVHNPKDAEITENIEIVAETLSNPYLLCLPKLLTVAKSNQIDVSSIISTVERLKNERNAYR